jgi:hypothetical protein
MLAQGATARRDDVREVSKGDVGSIRARERPFTDSPQISGAGDAATHERAGSPDRQPHSSQSEPTDATEFWVPGKLFPHGSCVSATLPVECR